jgi:hypothetical protein
VDLQLAYLAAPQNAAQVSNAQEAPQAAQAAAAASFAAQVHQREETIAETSNAEGTKLRTNPDREGDGEGYTPQDHRRTYSAPDDEASPLGLAGDGEHFIDVTA